VGIVSPPKSPAGYRYPDTGVLESRGRLLFISGGALNAVRIFCLSAGYSCRMGNNDTEGATMTQRQINETVLVLIRERLMTIVEAIDGDDIGCGDFDEYDDILCTDVIEERLQGLVSSFGGSYEFGGADGWSYALKHPTELRFAVSDWYGEAK